MGGEDRKELGVHPVECCVEVAKTDMRIADADQLQRGAIDGQADGAVGQGLYAVSRQSSFHGGERLGLMAQPAWSRTLWLAQGIVVAPDGEGAQACLNSCQPLTHVSREALVLDQRSPAAMSKSVVVPASSSSAASERCGRPPTCRSEISRMFRDSTSEGRRDEGSAKWMVAGREPRKTSRASCLGRLIALNLRGNRMGLARQLRPVGRSRTGTVA